MPKFMVVLLLAVANGDLAWAASSGCIFVVGLISLSTDAEVLENGINTSSMLSTSKSIQTSPKLDALCCEKKRLLVLTQNWPIYLWFKETIWWILNEVCVHIFNHIASSYCIEGTSKCFHCFFGDMDAPACWWKLHFKILSLALSFSQYPLENTIWITSTHLHCKNLILTLAFQLLLIDLLGWHPVTTHQTATYVVQSVHIRQSQCVSQPSC